MKDWFGEREDMLHREESEMSIEFSPATLHLIEEHERFRAKMENWKKVLDGSGEQELLRTLHEIVEFLDCDVELHARKEDEVYFPALEPYHSTVLMYEAHEL
ncbi:MAG: hemerythrin domain-containing protein, partial [Candidatus Fervidibacter sp.]|uniref:hemerythrin domain-containing protein n=1 Tax=Candidatus Fervidibacter sp. TaxID=3100871 RepID=UPI0040492FBE